MHLLTNLGTILWSLAVHTAAPFHPKARAWVNGRRGLWERLTHKADRLQGCLWMHSASVGEFEQGLPILEAIKAEHPELPVLLTFFSPSGYEARKDHPLATHVEYLPNDSARNAERLLSLVRPSTVLWVKYEFWRHHLAALKRHNVPTYLVSAIFRPDQPFFRWYGTAWRQMLDQFTWLFVQDERSRALLDGLGIRNVTVAGDTRFDRVMRIVADGRTVPLAKAFQRANDTPVLIAGSTWSADEDLLATAFRCMRTPPRLLVVPHEPSAQAVNRLIGTMPPPVERWTELERLLETSRPPTSDGDPIPNEGDPLFARTLVMDRTGLLARTYQHADMAYVGGGFGDGIHSLLEAAAWGIPVIFGPRHTKFAEAQGLIDADGGVQVSNAEELTSVVTRWMRDPQARALAGLAAERYVRSHAGATARITPAVLESIALHR